MDIFSSVERSRISKLMNKQPSLVPVQSRCMCCRLGISNVVSHTYHGGCLHYRNFGFCKICDLPFKINP